MEQTSSFWWNHITGAQMIVRSVCNSLLEYPVTLLDVPYDLPWRWEMRGAIEAHIKEQIMLHDIIVIIDAEDDCAADAGPGQYLLSHYGKTNEIINSYRERSGKTLQMYLVEKGVLRDQIFWIKGLSGAQAKQWMQFCAGFSGTEAKFILEIHDTPLLDSYEAEQIIRYSDHISHYDVLLFTQFQLDQNKELSQEWKQYLSAVITNLCDTDAEIAAAILEYPDLKGRSIRKLLEEIDSTGDYARRGTVEGSRHILSLLRSGQDAKISHRIWKAQVQTLFPIIELERQKLIGMLHQELQYTLDKYNVEQFDEIIKDPADLELGTICYLLSKHKLELSNTQAEYRLSFLHKCRNRLAHADPCDPLDIKQLIDRSCLKW